MQIFTHTHTKRNIQVIFTIIIMITCGPPLDVRCGFYTSNFDVVTAAVTVAVTVAVVLIVSSSPRTRSATVPQHFEYVM